MIAVLGVLLMELLTENGIDHLAAVRTGVDRKGLFSYLNDWLYMPAALLSISAIWLYIEKRVPAVLKLIGVLVGAVLVAWFGHLL